MTFELDISPKDRAAARFMARSNRALTVAAIDRKRETGGTCRALSEASGVSKDELHRILRGVGNPTLRTVGEIAHALGLRPVLTFEPINEPGGVDG